MNRRQGSASAPTARRAIASLAVAGALVLTATGCSMISPQATTITYDAAEGTNVYDSGPVEVRNAQIVANEDGTEGNFVAALINRTDETHTLNVELGEGSTISLTVRVPADTTMSLGTEDEEPILIEDLDALPGTDMTAFFQSGDAEGALVSVPVLDGTLDYLAPLAP
ncbi:DNA modification methylase [Microbacterium sp. M3]|uniref:DNA modification methylase n=1 Tax=Microbacterium arthrosphaerae TaxID=792652 RepID=A0ABU4H0Q1_9MICO|nr:MULTISPECIES: DNA modification methylase [Microbacterium]MDW4571474.1 DNA modification methylase [Microbacterium arthrosphaerae]MDW7605329.1 DNA modification methylase [Microbacterium sp. M3]